MLWVCRWQAASVRAEPQVLCAAFLCATRQILTDCLHEAWVLGIGRSLFDFKSLFLRGVVSESLETCSEPVILHFVSFDHREGRSPLYLS